MLIFNDLSHGKKGFSFQTLSFLEKIYKGLEYFLNAVWTLVDIRLNYQNFYIQKNGLDISNATIISLIKVRGSSLNALH